MDFTAKVLETIRQHHLLRYGDRIVVAVSGGPDSMVLLSVLNHLRQELGLHLIAGHVNHGLRHQADREQRLVQDFCSAHHLPFAARRIHLTPREKKSSLENAARQKRYAALQDIAQTHGCRSIALAHHQDDLAESVLLHLLRGAGLQGLQGFLPRRQMGKYAIIRPFYGVTRREIVVYLKRHRIPFCIDATNNDIKFLRNKIRRKLIPHIQSQYQSQCSAILASLAENAALDYDFLKQEGEALLKKVLTGNPKKTQIRVDLPKLQKAHPALQRMAVRLILERLQGDLRRMTYTHWRKIDQLAKDLPHNAIVHLPSGIQAQKTKGFLSFRIIKA